MARPHYAPGDLRKGDLCAAPVKRDGRRWLEDVRVTWVSSDGTVVDVETLPTKRRRVTFRAPFLVSSLRRPGTKRDRPVLV